MIKHNKMSVYVLLHTHTHTLACLGVHNNLQSFYTLPTRIHLLYTSHELKAPGHEDRLEGIWPYPAIEAEVLRALAQATEVLYSPCYCARPIPEQTSGKSTRRKYNRLRDLSRTVHA